MEKRQSRTSWGCSVGIFTAIGLQILFVIWAIWSGVSSIREKSHRAQTTKEETAQQAATYDAYQKQYEETIAALVMKHNAVRLEESVIINNTIDLQEILEKTNERPIWFIKHIADFIREEGRYYIIFDLMFFGQLGNATYRCILECDRESVLNLKEKKNKAAYEQFAVVAKNLTLENPLLRGRPFTIKGQCVEILVLPPSVSNPRQVESVRGS